MSIASSLLDDNLLQIKKNNDRYAFLCGVFSQFLWGMSNIQLKTYRSFFPNQFSLNSLTFWRSLCIFLIGYLMILRKNEKIKKISEIEKKNRIWFWLRSQGNYFLIMFWIIELGYFRVSTCQSFANCNPIIVLILSYFFLKEPFYFRYVFGVFISLIGTLMIISNEGTDNNTNNNNNNNSNKINIFIGTIVACIHLTLVSFSNFGQKILCNEKMSGEVQNFYLGLLSTIPSFIVNIFQCHFGFSNLLYVIYAFSNGILFFLANYFLAECLNYMPLNKFAPMNYLKIVFIFVFGFIILGEKVYMSDIIGSILILGFQVYNVYFPIKKKKEGINIQK